MRVPENKLSTEEELLRRVEEPRWTSHPAVLVALACAVVGLLVLAFVARGDDGGAGTAASGTGEGTEGLTSESTEQDSAPAGRASGDTVVDDTDPGDSATSGTANGESGGGESGGGESDSQGGGSGPMPAAMPEPDGAYVAATLNLDAQPDNGFFVLKGRVPDQTTADRVIAAANLSYQPFVQSELKVDDTLDPAPWLATAGDVIGLLPMVTDGTVMVSEGGIDLSVRSPTEQQVVKLETAAGILSGQPVEVGDAVITDLDSPQLNVVHADGKLILQGRLPSAQLTEGYALLASQAYGVGNVVNELEVDEGTYRAYWMAAVPQVLQLFTVFPDYELAVTNDQFQGVIRGGLNFDTGSTELTGPGIESLNFGITGMARDISLGMRIVGHTDDVGSEEFNQRLSLERAKAVVDYFDRAGIDPARMVAVGAGESEPIADNSTEAGRAANRRVEFQFGSVTNFLDS